MGYMGPYGSVHMETCSKGNGNGVIINWVLCPIVMARAMTKISFAFVAVCMNEPEREATTGIDTTMSVNWHLLQIHRMQSMSLEYWSVSKGKQVEY